ncbi:MAG: putative dipeptidase [Haloplasmataceae bacterium]|jgi:succinyl-diaminopimelate desuccinylase|nr:putative dipeptidase [Haloplasmataceae bacterium]
MENNFNELFKKYHQAFLKDITGLLQIPSVLTEFDASKEHPFGDDIHKAFEYMLNLGKKDGFTVKNVDNYAGHLEIGEGDEILGILCHLDVVPVGDGWKFPPFSATVEDGKIIARGALDDKGPTMAAYYAVKMLKDLNVKFNKKVRIILGLDEESGWRCVNHYFKKEKMPNVGFAPDANFPLIYGEKGMITSQFTGSVVPNGLYELNFGERTNVVPDKAYAIVNKEFEPVFNKFLGENNYNGEVKPFNESKIQIYAYGKNAHAMEPDHGLNAGFILLQFLNIHFNNQFVKFAYERLAFDSRAHKLGVNYTNDIMGDLTLNVGVCKYNNGEFKILLNFRYPIEFNSESMKAKMNELADKYNFKYEVLTESKPHFVDPNSDLVKTLHQAYIKYTGDDLTPIMTIGGGTYARSLKNAVAFGPEMPGKEALIHQPNEYAELEDLHKAVAIYAEAIYNLTR